MLELCRGCIGIMEKNTETTIKFGLYRGYIGITENKMETTIMLGSYRGHIRIGALWLSGWTVTSRV